MGELQIQRDRQEEVGKQIRSWEKFVASVLPRHMNRDAGRIVRVILTEYGKTPKLFETTTQSQYGCIMQAAQLGLEIGSALGYAYLIPRKDHGVMTCTLQIGYKGMIELARRSGQIADIWAEVVYRDDTFVYHKGERQLTHTEPERTEAPADKDIVAAYAVVLYKDGTRHPEVMQRWELNRLAAKNVDPTSSLYVHWYPEWCKKTVVKRALKYAPKSPEIQRAINLDDEAEIGMQHLALPLPDPSEDPTGRDVTPKKLEAAAGAEKPDGDGGKENPPVAASGKVTQGEIDV